MRLSVGDQHSRFLSILTRSGGYYHCFGVPKRFPRLLNPKVLLRVGHQQSRFWPIMARFVDYYSLFWGPGVISTINELILGCVYVSVINTHRFGRFWSVSWTITHCFGVPERFPRLTNPGVHLRFGHQHSRFWPILTRFVDYYSPVLGPKAISTIVEPQGALTCRSSSLTVLVDSAPFRGILLTVLGSRSDFHD